MTALYIQKQLYIMFHNYNYKLHNAYIFGWESDFFGISQSGYSVEVEIKVYYQDFKKDFEKTLKYKSIKKHDILIDCNNNHKSNKFYFACPVGLIKPNELPKEYGLIYIDKEKSTQCNVVKNPKFLHKNELLKDQWFCRKLLDKYYYRNLELIRLLEIRQSEINYNQKRLYDNMYF